MFGPKEDIFINLESDKYFNVIDWDRFEPAEPPCLQFFAKDHLEALQYSNEIIELPAFPCHSQNTERFVHTVHESAMAVTDEQRMGHILSKLESRQKYSKLEFRQNFVD
ncbi:uncharacterized protein LOC129238420 [Anastrepha obliqua]|uniref:uncharacterized protein LOC129238420 n=1 Tax=Anastrepha obliqua TaxID=95512 RepID=UPI002409FA5C|nr:uncharacterized protein LOC129238420 [Anastrepha obliqua]